MLRLKSCVDAAVLAACLFAAGTASAYEDIIEHGRYVFFAAGCVSCHSGDQSLGGGRPITTAFGTFYPPNISPSREHGIGIWTTEDMQRALREGVNPQGEHYYPAFPYPSYTRMTREDMQALYAYLMTLPAAYRESRPHDIPWPFSSRGMLSYWKDGRFTPGEFQPDPEQSPQWNRGAYIAQALGHCSECHTPRDYLGSPLAERYLAGVCAGPDGMRAPNITPDRGTGIGDWTCEQLTDFLSTGRRPDGSYTGGVMAEVLGTSCMQLTESDRHALATYLQSIPPVHRNMEVECTPYNNTSFLD